MSAQPPSQSATDTAVTKSVGSAGPWVGKRCELRFWEPYMAESIVKAGNNYNVWRNMLDFFPRPYERLHADMWIQSNQVMPNRLRNLAICVDGVAVGSIGVTQFSPEPNLHHYLKIGYFLDEQFWGKGIASEALGLMKDWVLSKLFAELANEGEWILRLEARVFSYNPASAKILEKNGFHLEGVSKLGYSKEGKYYDGLNYVVFNEAAIQVIDYPDRK